jgi:hypothetical protein
MSVPDPVFVTYHKPRTKNEMYVSLYDYEASSVCGLSLAQPSIWPCKSRACALDPTLNDAVKSSAAHPRIPEAFVRAEPLVLGTPVHGGGGGLRGCLDSGRDGIFVLVLPLLILLPLLLGYLLDHDFRGLEAEGVDLGDVGTYGLGGLCCGFAVRHCGGGGRCACGLSTRGISQWRFATQR